MAKNAFISRLEIKIIIKHNRNAENGAEKNLAENTSSFPLKHFFFRQRNKTLFSAEPKNKCVVKTKNKNKLRKYTEMVVCVHHVNGCMRACVWVRHDCAVQSALLMNL